MPVFDYAEQQRIIDEMRAKDLFFVGGVPKSGTTWVQILLNAHPEVSCVGEGHLLTSLGPLLASAMKKYNTVIGHKNRSVLQGFGGFPSLVEQNFGFLFASATLLLLAASGKAQHVRVVGEKTPDNIGGIGFLSDIFPAAKFIHVLRDPRDSTISAWFHNERLDAGKFHETFPTLTAFAQHAAQSWCDEVGRWERFAKAAPARCAMVRYEDLAEQPQAEMTRMFEFLGVSTRATTVDECVAAGDFARLSGGRPAGVEDRGSLLRRGLSGDWRNHFAQGDDIAFRWIAGDAMTRYGYVD